MVEVEQGGLRALAEHGLPVAQGPVDEQRGIRDVGPQSLGVALGLLGDRLELERRSTIDPLQPDVLLGERDLDLLPQDLRVEEILRADPEARGLVCIGRADPAPGRADLQLPEPPLTRLVERHVPGHDEVRVARQADGLGRDAPCVELVELLDEDPGIDDAARAQHALLAPEDPRRHVPELVRLALGDDRVAGVGAALVAADEVGMLGEQVDDLALPLVPPLRADDDCGGHEGSVCQKVRLTPRA